MKKISLIIIFCAALVVTSCSKWLDVSPKAEIKSEDMFESEVGFKDAIIGVYLTMSEQALYGRELTVGMMDVVGQQYNLSKDNRGANYYFAAHDYGNAAATAIIEQAWNRFYYAIANINNLLYYIDKNREKIHPTHYSIIKGEALGLRAFLHFDLFRMFSYENLANSPAQLDQLSIPYVYAYSKNVTKQSKVREVLANIHKDLSDAEELLSSYDPWSPGGKGDDYVLPNDDRFYNNRQKRFNYWAVVATQARVFLWEGNSEKALECSARFIAERENGSTLKWITDKIVNEVENKCDYTFSTEHIFQLNATKQYEQIKNLLEPKSGNNENVNLISHTLERANALFQFNEGIGSSDYRYTKLYDKSNFTFLKFYEKEDYDFKNFMPLIRMSEMYYIAAECLNATGSEADKITAIEHLNTVRKNRGIADSKKLEETLTNAQVTKEIEREWMKEFLCEGQMFYFYKRLGYISIPNFTGKPKYKMPLPENEIITGGREDATNE